LWWGIKTRVEASHRGKAVPHWLPISVKGMHIKSNRRRKKETKSSGRGVAENFSFGSGKAKKPNR